MLKLITQKERNKRIVGITQMALGIASLLLSIGFFVTSDAYGLPLFMLLVSTFMIISGRITYTL